MLWTKLIEASAIVPRIRAAGVQIRADYGAEAPLLVGVLEGAAPFLAQLAEAIAPPRDIATMRVRSYGAGIASGGTIEFLRDPDANLFGRHVLIVEDIYDSGRTLQAVVDRLRRQGPQSLAVACLLVKAVPRAAALEIRYGLFRVPDVFVVGAGLDLDGAGRSLPDIWALAPGAPLDEARAQIARL